MGKIRRKYDFLAIEKRLKSIIGSENDYELAEVLGLKRNAYSTRKRNNSLPLQEIIKFCRDNQVSLDQLFDNNPIAPSNKSIVNIKSNNNHNIQIDGDIARPAALASVANEQIKRIVDKLRYAPPAFLDTIETKLDQFRVLADDIKEGDL